MSHPSCRSLIFAAVLSLPVAADAAALVVANASFESPNTANGTFSGSQTLGPAGWTVYNTGPTNSNRFFGVWDPTGTASFVSIPHGQQVGAVFLDDALGLEAGLQQVLGNTLQLSTQYTLTVGVGNFAPSAGDPWNFTGFPGYRVELLAGTTVLAADNNTLSPAEGVFLTSTVNFTTGVSHANAGQALRIRLVNLNGPGVEVNFDQVGLDAEAVPEPSGLALLALGAVLGLRARRREKV